MKFSARVNVWLVILSFLIPCAGEAATMYELAGNYSVLMSSKINVQKFGKDQTELYETCNVVSADVSSGSFTIDVFGVGTLSGPLAMASNGKKLAFSFDAAGLEGLRDIIAFWVVEWAEAYGYTVVIDSVVFDSIKYSPAAISRNTGLPTKAKVSAKGVLQGIVNGEVQSKKFNYSTTITFLGSF
jgi:hypothetical protein